MNTKILITCPDLQKGGGVASYCRMLQPHLGSDVDYFTVGARNDGENGWLLVSRMLGDYIKFWFKLKTSSYELVHINPSLGTKALVRDGLLVLLAKARGCKVLIFIHGWDEECEAMLRVKCLRLFQRVYFKADSIIVLANEFKEKLVEMGCNKPIIVETTTVDDDIFTSNSSIHRLPAYTTFNILYLSRIEKEKGIYEAINAFRFIKAKHPQAILTVAGDGAELTHVRQYVTELQIKDVHFTGYITGKEKDEAFRQAHVYFFPTWFGEGMPISVLEAMAYGLPVITRPVGGIKDFFDDGIMGFISDSVEPNLFAGLLDRLINDSDLSDQIGENNRKYAREHFAASKVAERIKNIYNNVLVQKI